MDQDQRDQDKANAPGNPLADQLRQPAQEIVDPRNPDADQGPEIEVDGKDQATRGGA
jgi:hypothetical protein